MADDNTKQATDTSESTTRPMSDAEKFQLELNQLMAKYPTVKLMIEQKITITEKQ